MKHRCYQLSLIIISLLCGNRMIYGNLTSAPDSITFYKEIATVYNNKLPELFNQLSPQERIFIYYLFRASLPGNQIAADQSHRHSVSIRNLFENIVQEKEKILTTETSFNTSLFIDQATTYLVYLIVNHSHYYLGEHAEEKRTPQRLGLTTLTKENIAQAAAIIDLKNSNQLLNDIEQSLFNQEFEQTLTIPNNIEQSAINFYSSDFTENDFFALPQNMQTHCGVYFDIDHSNGERNPRAQVCKIGGKYDKELAVSLYWLDRARTHANNYPAVFDEHISKSLDLLCQYIQTGDEELFKQHSIEWLKTKSKIDYNFGFIETYQDPKSYRGSFQAEVTIKSIDLDKLNALLPALEKKLPFPHEYKRDNLHDICAMPNASINTKVFASGHLGPANVVLAYALPNYEEIRSKHGTKQIIYAAEKSLAERINPQLQNLLSYTDEQHAWFMHNDPDGKLRSDITSLHVILHETLGHGSGKLDKHTFVDGEPLIVEGKTYGVGDTIDVTSNNIQQFLAGCDSTIEELRAEIIALHVSISSYDELASSGLLSNWPTKIEKNKMIELFILDMAHWGLRRLLNQPENATHISGAHAQANTTILNWLLDHDGLTLTEKTKTIDGKEYTVVAVEVADQKKAIDAIEKLAIHVQKIKSTGNGIQAHALIDIYGKPIKHPHHMKILKQNRQSIVGDVKMSATISPYFHPITDDNGNITDITAQWPNNIIEHNQQLKKLQFSCEI